MLAVTKSVAVEFARKRDPIICVLLHPGTVDTDLSRPFQRNVPEGKLFTKEFSVQKLLGIINSAKIHDNGKFFAWDGQEIPWWSVRFIMIGQHWIIISEFKISDVYAFLSKLLIFYFFNVNKWKPIVDFSISSLLTSLVFWRDGCFLFLM